jgi:hypothetical protein
LYRIGAVKREWSVIALRLGDAFWGLLDWDGAYDEEEKRRKGLVSLNACTAAMQPARAAIERRIVVSLLVCRRSLMMRLTAR